MAGRAARGDSGLESFNLWVAREMEFGAKMEGLEVRRGWGGVSERVLHGKWFS